MKKKKIVEKIIIIVLFCVVLILGNIYYHIQIDSIQSNLDIIEESLGKIIDEGNFGGVRYIDEVKTYTYVNLRINMPLNLVDLENYFEEPIQSEMDKNGIGEITGDGMPLDDNGVPYAADIEIEVEKSELDELKNILNLFKLPSGSYLEIDGEVVEEYGDLNVVELGVGNLSKERAEKVFNDLKEKMKDNYVYASIYNYNYYGKIEKIYFCGENKEKMQEIIDRYIKENGIENIV